MLATTATANERVTADVAAQLGADTVTLRGSLARASLRLAVVPGLSALERYAWVADALPTLPGSGIVYVLTVAETERLSGVPASSGATTWRPTPVRPQNREELEDRLRGNEIKAVVATSALGMGYDKPDLAFCLHVGSPASPVAYYQQVGRAGRALDDAVAVLVPGSSDERIWDYFATVRHPDRRPGRRVLGVLARRPAEPAGARGGHRHPARPAGDAAQDPGRRRRGRPRPRRVAGDRAALGVRRGEVVGAAPRSASAEADLMRRYAHGRAA